MTAKILKLSIPAQNAKDLLDILTSPTYVYTYGSRFAELLSLQQSKDFLTVTLQINNPIFVIDLPIAL